MTSYDKIDANAAIEPGELHPPAAAAFWTFANQDPSPITLTHDRILIDLSINGVNGRFILDTGADGIYLNDKFADRAKTIPLEGGATAASIYEEVPIRMRKVDTLTFGGATLHNVIAASQDFDRDDSRGLDWQGYDGLIGFDFFAGAIVKLDTYASKVTVLDPSTDVSTAQGVPVIVDLSAGTPAVPMVLNKTIDVNALLDTGNPGLVLFGPDLRKKRHLNIYGCGNFDRLELGPIVDAARRRASGGSPATTSCSATTSSSISTSSSTTRTDECSSTRTRTKGRPGDRFGGALGRAMAGKVLRPARLERATLGLGVPCAIHI